MSLSLLLGVLGLLSPYADPRANGFGPFRVEAVSDAMPQDERRCKTGTVRRGSECIPLSKATDVEVREYLVDLSISRYAGNCPCPYHRDRAGRSCGRRSAYSRPGGAAPLCYPSDVSDSVLKNARRPPS